MTRHGTAIPWTYAPGYSGEVWNVVVGCSRVSSGCDHCYAFALHDRRYAANVRATRNLARNRAGTPAGARAEGYCSGRGMSIPFPSQYDVPFSKVQLLHDRLDQPLRWRSPRMVMVPSMGDLFHEDVPDSFILDVFDVMERAAKHTFLVLTKRPERMRLLVLDALPNIWLGVSVEDQAGADERIPLLLETPAAKHFVSAEPLLGPLQLHDAWLRTNYADLSSDPTVHAESAVTWLIVGAESGPRHRRMELAWAESLYDQCKAAGVKWYGKQAAANRSGVPLPGRLGERNWPL